MEKKIKLSLITPIAAMSIARLNNKIIIENYLMDI